jgi:ABC-type transport system involved in multi-copper enzyme maturation permease subunit
MTATSMTTPATTPSQPGLGTLVAMETTKLRKRPMTLVIFGIVTLLVVAVMTIGYVTSRAQERQPGVSLDDHLSSFLLPGAVENGFDAAGGLGSILLVVLAASIIGSEYSWGTVRVLVGSGVSRTKLLASKLLTMAMVTVLFVIAGVLATTLSSVVLTIAGGHTLTLGWLDGAAAIDIVLMLVRTTFTLFISVVLGFAIAVITRSVAAGIALGIGFGIAEAILAQLLESIGGIGETLSRLLITPNISAITSLNGFGDRVRPEDAIDPWRATALLTAYMVVLLAIAFTVFRRRDIASAS